MLVRRGVIQRSAHNILAIYLNSMIDGVHKPLSTRSLSYMQSETISCDL